LLGDFREDGAGNAFGSVNSFIKRWTHVGTLSARGVNFRKLGEGHSPSGIVQGVKSDWGGEKRVGFGCEEAQLYLRGNWQKAREHRKAQDSDGIKRDMMQ